MNLRPLIASAGLTAIAASGLVIGSLIPPRSDEPTRPAFNYTVPTTDTPSPSGVSPSPSEKSAAPSPSPSTVAPHVQRLAVEPSPSTTSPSATPSSEPVSPSPSTGTTPPSAPASPPDPTPQLTVYPGNCTPHGDVMLDPAGQVCQPISTPSPEES